MKKATTNNSQQQQIQLSSYLFYLCLPGLLINLSKLLPQLLISSNVGLFDASRKERREIIFFG